jgi:hypothetical protein
MRLDKLNTISSTEFAESIVDNIRTIEDAIVTLERWNYPKGPVSRIIPSAEIQNLINSLRTRIT